jgi:mannose-1-phosphate guanylyltransferase
MPKHFLPLVHGKSLFELNWEAMRSRYQPEEIYLQTNKEQSKIAKNLVPEIVTENIFIEPEVRNQGPATGLAAALLKRIGKGGEPFFLIQVDDLRTPAEQVLKMMDLAEKLGIETGKYITGGFEPDRIIAGVDYLLKGELVKELNGVKVYKVADFIDRSETAKLKELMTSGKLLLHANHTSMTPDNLLEMYKTYRPDWYEPLLRISNGADVNTEFQKMPKGTLEEITKQVHAKGDSLVIELPFEWIDFGTWESLDKFYKDNDMSPENGGLVEIEAKNVFGWSVTGKKIAVIGLDDIIVVEGKDGILVCRKDKCGRVGEII